MTHGFQESCDASDHAVDAILEQVKNTEKFIRMHTLHKHSKVSNKDDLLTLKNNFMFSMIFLSFGWIYSEFDGNRHKDYVTHYPSIFITRNFPCSIKVT